MPAAMTTAVVRNHADQLSQLLRSGELLAGFLWPRRWHHDPVPAVVVLGVLVCTVDTGLELYGLTEPWRERAFAGTFTAARSSTTRAPSTARAPDTNNLA